MFLTDQLFSGKIFAKLTLGIENVRNEVQFVEFVEKLKTRQILKVYVQCLPKKESSSLHSTVLTGF